MCGAAPDRHDPLAVAPVEIGPQVGCELDQPRRKGSRAHRNVRRADRHPPLVAVPFIGPREQHPGLRVHQPDVQSHPPTLPGRLDPAGHEDVEQLPEVLLQPPHSVLGQASRDGVRPADPRGEALHEGAAEIRSQQGVRIAQKGPATLQSGLPVVPRRKRGRLVDQRLEASRRLAQDVLLQLDSRPQEPLGLLRGKSGKIGYRGIGVGVANPHVDDVEMRERRIQGAGPVVPRGEARRNLHRLQHSLRRSLDRALRRRIRCVRNASRAPAASVEAAPAGRAGRPSSRRSDVTPGECRSSSPSSGGRSP